MIVKANDKELLEQVVGKETADDGWLEVEVDLSDYAGKEVFLELVNHPNGWMYEAAYWAQIEIAVD